jgi:hypothetical protein
MVFMAVEVVLTEGLGDEIVLVVVRLSRPST